MSYRVENANGTVRMHVYTSDKPGPNGTFTFANINLTAVGKTGESGILDPNVVEFADADGEIIQLRTINGTLTIGIRGDANDDGKVTGIDAMYIAQYVVGTRSEL